jgi:hypothetical protein
MVSKLKRGTADIAPTEIDIAYAYGLTWRPRPVMQTYSSYTAGLDQLDATYLGSARAPDRILLQFSAIDGRYPLFDEPAATRALFQGYRTEEVSSGYALFSRRPQPFSHHEQVIASATVRLGTEAPVPQIPGDVLAAVTLPYSSRGRVLDLAAKPSIVTVRFVLANAEKSQPYRLIIGTAGDGLPVRWYITDMSSLVLYAQGGHPAPVSGLIVTADNPADYTADYRIVFMKVS